MGSIAGLVATLVMSAVFGHIEWTYGVMAVVILAGLAPTVWAPRGEGMARPSPREHEPLRVAVAGFLRPLASGDFAWVIYTRTLITAGIYCILPYLQLFFRDVVHVANAANFVATWELLLLLAATPVGPGRGLGLGPDWPQGVRLRSGRGHDAGRSPVRHPLPDRSA